MYRALGLTCRTSLKRWAFWILLSRNLTPSKIVCATYFNESSLKSYVALDAIDLNDLLNLAPISQAKMSSLEALNNSVSVSHRARMWPWDCLAPSGGGILHNSGKCLWLAVCGDGTSLWAVWSRGPAKAPAFTSLLCTQTGTDLQTSARTERLLFKKFDTAGLLPELYLFYFLLSYLWRWAY